MRFREAVNNCKVRGYIARPNGYHADIPDSFKFAKNHNVPLECRVAWQDQVEHDWQHFDSVNRRKAIRGREGGEMTEAQEIISDAEIDMVHKTRVF